MTVFGRKAETGTILITGSNRGLGLEWARQYAQGGWRVYATCRQPQAAEELQGLATQYAGLSIHRLDVTSAADLAALATELRGEPIDLLINNAGVYFERWGKDRLGGIDYQDWQTTMAVNALGPMRVAEALMDNLAASGRRLLVTITSHMGSIADIGSPNDYAYRSSKAALNAAMVGLSHEVKALGVGVLLLHPGWVRTRMGGESAPVSPEQSVEGMRRLIDGFRLSDSGRFLRYDGRAMPW
jgi:NAD(P)-dependent dehydrogenase (short-subunit alcohol dehydrogenase family)